MKYKSKETGQVTPLADIKQGFNELVGNSNYFNEYVDRFDDFLKDYYEEVEDEQNTKGIMAPINKLKITFTFTKSITEIFVTTI